MHFSWPVDSTGFSRLEASSVPPEAAPAPITVWISSMNRIAFGLSTNCFSTALRRCSKSPRYLVPASSAPMSSAYTVDLVSRSGTLPSTMRRARRSAMAVLPTPASPTSSGLFLRRRLSVLVRVLALVGLRRLGDAVRDVVHHVEARDALLLQEVHRVRILLAEDRHQHVGAGDFFLAGGLHVQDGALDHALEAEGRLGVDLAVGGD